MRLLWGYLLVVVGAILAMTFGIRGLLESERFLQGTLEEGGSQNLRSFGAVPNFSLTERSGRQLELAELRDKVWIANFMYTACPDVCPLQSAKMAKLQAEFSDSTDVRLVSITVDPERDTPQVLSRYAEQFNAHPDRWFFVTGKLAEISYLAQQGFRLSAIPLTNSKEQDAAPMLHSNRFVLVDGQARIRGYYRSNEAEELQRLRHDLNTLLEDETV